MTLRGSTSLVTGAGGFIGSHLVEHLVSAGARVRAFVRYNSRNDPGNLTLLDATTMDSIDVVYGDLRDSGAVLTAMNGCDYVFHLGALIAIPYSYKNPRDVIATNVTGAQNVFEAARSVQPARIVHVSTSEVYGTAQRVPIAEDHPLVGQSPYSASKISADKIAESYHLSFEVPIVTVRPFNCYGPRQSARAVIPTIISQILTRDRVELGALAPTRDFTFVRDTARGMALAAEAEGVEGRVINLGSNQEISIEALAHLLMAMMKRPLPVHARDERLRPPSSEVERLRADASLAANLLGWHPEVSLDDGLAETVSWIEGHLDRYRPDRYEV